MIDLGSIFRLPTAGVIIVEDVARKLVWVGYTQSMGASLMKLYDERGVREYGPGQLQLRIESPNLDIETLKLHTEYYKDLYGSRGYGELIPYGRKAIQYRVRMVASEGARFMDVEVVPARGGEGKIVGRFRKKGEARAFIETYYGPDNQLCFPVVARNSDTKEFMEAQKASSKIRY